MKSIRYVQYDPYQWEGGDVKSCLEYWHDIKGERFSPCWQDFQWDKISIKIIPYFIVIDIDKKPDKMKYRFYGTAHVRASSIDLTGKSPLDIAPNIVGKSIFDQYNAFAEGRVPTLFFNSVHNNELNDSVEISEVSLCIPFSNDGVNVTNILSFTDLRNVSISPKGHQLCDLSKISIVI